MKMEKKLFLIGVGGILISIIYNIVAMYIISSYWDGYIYGNTAYCYLLGRYSEDILSVGIGLFYLSIGFTIGIGSIMVGNRRIFK